MRLGNHDWNEVLRRTAFNADNHAVKGALAIEALSAEAEFADLEVGELASGLAGVGFASGVGPDSTAMCI